MAQSIRITITPDLEKALQVLRQSTLGTLNTTELIKMAVGAFAQSKKNDIAYKNSNSNKAEVDEVAEMNAISAQSFYEWAKEDDTLTVNNIAHPEKLKPFTPKPYVRTR